MDPEIKQRFDTLEGAMARLAEAQTRTEERVERLADTMANGFATLTAAQLRTDERLGMLGEELGMLGERLGMLGERLGLLGERVDRLAQLMIRGHTEAAERHATVIDRLDKLEGG